MVEKVRSTKYLGIILDENLNWEDHIDNLIKCLIKTGNSFKIIKHRVHEKNKKVLYNAYILSKIQYGIEVYGRASSTNMQKVQVQQNRALKILFNRDYFTSTTVLHKDLDILLVKDIYKQSIVKFVYKYNAQILPSIFENMFPVNCMIHTHNTRQSKNIHLSNPINKLGESLTRHQGAVLWNALPKEIRQVETIKTFTKKFKKHLLLNY